MITKLVLKGLYTYYLIELSQQPEEKGMCYNSDHIKWKSDIIWNSDLVNHDSQPSSIVRAGQGRSHHFFGFPGCIPASAHPSASSSSHTELWTSAPSFCHKIPNNFLRHYWLFWKQGVMLHSNGFLPSLWLSPSLTTPSPNPQESNMSLPLIQEGKVRFRKG